LQFWLQFTVIRTPTRPHLAADHTAHETVATTQNASMTAWQGGGQRS
jgi:hypothetical protein